MPFAEIRSIFHIEKWPADIRRPAWADLDDLIAVQQAAFKDVLSSLNRQRVALVVGAASRGKTFTAYSIGFHISERETEDWTVRYASAPDLRYNDEIEDIRVRHAYRRTKSLYIIDDSHKNLTDAGRFLDWALRAGEGNCHFLFILRALSEDQLDEPFSLLIGKGCIVPVTPDISYIRDITRRYIKSTRHQHPKSPYMSPSDAEVERFIAEKVGTDLDRLMRFLTEAWDPNKQPLTDADEERILRSTWRKFDLDNVERRELLSFLSALGRFDIAVHALFAESLPSARHIQELIREGHVATIMGRKGRPSRFLELAQSKDCEYILKAIAQARGIDLKQASAELIKQYIKSRPPNIIPVFRALWGAGERELIKEAFKDAGAMISLQESLIGCSTSAKHKYVKFIEIVSPELARKLLSHTRLMQELVEGEKGGPAYRIQTILPALSTVMHLREFFAPWSPSDYRKTVNSAQLNTLKLLFYSLKKWNLPDVAIRFGEQITRARLAKLLDPTSDASLTELNHLIGNLEFVPSTIGPFFRKLATIDIGLLLTKAEAKDVRWLLWQMLLFDYLAASRFVRKHLKALAEVVQSSKPPNTFWVLWNVFQANRRSACALIRLSQPTQVFQEQIALSEAPTINLACLGLLHLCTLKVTDVTIPRGRLNEIVEAINNEKDGALAVLALEALRLILSNKQLLAVKTKVSLATIGLRVSSFPVSQTKTFLQETLDRFA